MEKDSYRLEKSPNIKNTFIKIINEAIGCNCICLSENIVDFGKDFGKFLITIGQRYILLSNGESKLLFFYNSKNNTKRILENKIKEFVHNSEMDYIQYREKLKGLENTLENKLGFNACKFKKRDGSGEYAYRINDNRFKSLHISEDGKEVINVSFNESLDNIKNINEGNIEEIEKQCKKELELRFLNLKKTLSKIS